MKRIVTCPTCETKLSVFDIGKPISQKCPKCNNTFVVESEDKKDSAPAGGENPKEAPAPGADAAKPEEKTTVPETGKQPSASAPRPTTIKRAPAPVASIPSEPEPAPAGGPSFLFSFVVVGLLVLIIVLQVIMKVRADKQYGSVIKHLQAIETRLAK